MAIYVWLQWFFSRVSCCGFDVINLSQQYLYVNLRVRNYTEDEEERNREIEKTGKSTNSPSALLKRNKKIKKEDFDVLRFYIHTDKWTVFYKEGSKTLKTNTAKYMSIVLRRLNTIFKWTKEKNSKKLEITFKITGWILEHRDM